MINNPKIPQLYSQEDVEDPIVHVTIKLLTKQSMFWLLTEFDPKSLLGFGYCQLHEGGGELGYVNLEELKPYKHLLEIKNVEEPLSKIKKRFQ